MKTEVFERITVKQIAAYWISSVAIFSAIYYGLAFTSAAIIQDGQILTTTLEGLGNSVYFSFITALTLGYGNIAPVGIAKAMAVLEAIGSVTLFGLFIGKLVSLNQEKLVEEIKELSFEEATNSAITELYLFRSQAKDIQEKLEGAKKQKGLNQELESLQLTLTDALHVFNESKITITNSHNSLMYMSLVTNSINYSLSKLVELLEEFNKRKIDWKKESTTATYNEAERIKEKLVKNYTNIKSDDQSSSIVAEKLEDLNKIISVLQKLMQK